MANEINRVVKILMGRDNMTREEAEHLLNQVRDEMNDAIAEGDYDLAEDIMYSDLGLEMDYIMDVLM